MAIRDGKVRNREVWATFFQGKGDMAAAYDPAQVKAAKSAGAPPPGRGQADQTLPPAGEIIGD